jgi:hypothetical protein
MPERPRHAPFARPPAVPIHDDRDMSRDRAMNADLREEVGGVR